jgi:hypothetical protein
MIPHYHRARDSCNISQGLGWNVSLGIIKELAHTQRRRYARERREHILAQKEVVVTTVRALQAQRFKGPPLRTNADMGPAKVRDHASLTRPAST